MTIEEGKLRRVRGIVKNKGDAVERRPVRKKRGEVIARGIVMIDDRKGGGITVVKKDGRRRKRRGDEKEIGERRGVVGNRGKDERRSHVNDINRSSSSIVSRKRMQFIMSHSVRIHYVRKKRVYCFIK